jgi:Glycosyltransferase family 87
MPPDQRQVDSSVVLASGGVAGASAGQADTTVALPGLSSLDARLPWPRLRIGLQPVAARLALGTLLVGTFAITAFARSGPSVLVPKSGLSFPPWEAGPLHTLLGRLPHAANALSIGFSCVVIVMLLAYAAVVYSVRTLSMRTIVICIVALHAIVLLSPPLQLSDVFNYLGYARLGGLHHLNPYTHVIAQEIHDPVFRFTSWHNLHSPYGPLFTAASYPLAFLPLPVAYWTLKVVTLLASLAFIALVWQCARRLGRDPRFAVTFVALNPVYLMYAIAGFHNDFFMLVPSTAAIALLLARRDRTAGAVLMLAVAVKFTAILLLPFLLLAARPARRRGSVLAGAVIGATPLLALSLALFGFSIPNLSDQSTLLTDFSIPNVFGWIIGIGGASPGLLRAANVALVVTVALLLRRRREWLVQAGWGTVALIASLAWLVPWYVVWVLPLAALGTSLRLRRAAIALTVYVIVAFIPMTGMILSSHGINPMSSPVGQASQALQKKLAQ